MCVPVAVSRCRWASVSKPNQLCATWFLVQKISNFAIWYNYNFLFFQFLTEWKNVKCPFQCKVHDVNSTRMTVFVIKGVDNTRHTIWNVTMNKQGSKFLANRIKTNKYTTDITNCKQFYETWFSLFKMLDLLHLNVWQIVLRGFEYSSVEKDAVSDHATQLPQQWLFKKTF